MGSIVLGNGSNDVLELVALAFLGPGRAAVFSQHCFAVYPLATQARGARSIVVPAKNYGHDLEAMAKAIDDETYVVWIANPNNPTGTFARHEELEAFLRARARARAGGARRGLQRIPAARAARRHGEAAQAPSQPGGHAHLLQGLRARRAARRLRARAPVGRRRDEPRAPAVQRQQHGARRGDGGARRHGVRRAQLCRSTCRA